MNALLPVAVFLPLVFAFAGRAIKGKATRLHNTVFIVAAAFEFITVGVLALAQDTSPLSFSLPRVVGLGLAFRADSFRGLYALIAAFLWLMTMIFAMEYLKNDHARKRYCFYDLVTLTGVMGVFLSADLYTTFVFFELMSFASYPLVIHEETPEARKAGETYLGVAVISGMMLLVGIFFLQAEAGTLVFEELRVYFASSDLSDLGFAGGILILLGFGTKAGMFPLHIWLPQAHPVAPAPASALLSGILTKTGVFGIIVLSCDVMFSSERFALLLLALAVVTMFLGAVLALFSVNLKRTLACSSMSQIGFILVGVTFTVLLGKEGGLAQNGALLHMVNHSLIKLVLFICAGVVAMNTHALDLNDIRGYGRKKPFLAVIFGIGALGIMGVPLFNGYVSKTMIHESIVEYTEIASCPALFTAVEWIFLLSGGLTVAYMTKLFVCLFIEKNADKKRQEAFDKATSYLSLPSRIVLVLSALPLLIIGLFPNETVQRVTATCFDFFNVEKFTHTVEFFGFECLKGGFISLAIGFAVYFALVRTVFIRKGVYKNLWPKRLDLERLIYRPVLVTGTKKIITHVISPVAYFFEFILCDGTVWFIRHIVRPVAYFFEFILCDGTVWFILTVVRFFALLFDRIVLFLNKTVLKNHVYRFKDETFSMRVGELLDKLLSKDKKHRFAEKADSFTDTVGRVVSAEYASFSFAFAMISVGIIIVLLFAVFG